MRFLHTADWHLGRLFHAQHLTEDQAYVLDQFVDLARELRPDAIIIAGDIYDRAVPPPDAVRLLDDVLSRLVLDLELTVVMIAGNHDSPDRLGFGSQLLAAQRLHIFGATTPRPGRVTFQDEHGPVHLYALPYAEPPIVRQVLEDDEVQGHDAAMRAQLARIRAIHPAAERSIVVAHAFVAGGSESESERPLSIGGAGTVDANCFAGFDYVVLGHLHRPQWIDARQNTDQAGASATDSAKLEAAKPSVAFEPTEALEPAVSIESATADESVEATKAAASTGAPAAPLAQTELFFAEPARPAHRPASADPVQGADLSRAVTGHAPARPPQIRYSGSLLKYSFSETDHRKSISIVELDAAGRCTVQEFSLTPRRDVRRIEGDLAELIVRGRVDTARDDYILATLHDRGALLDPIGKLREVYPNVLQIERSFLNADGAGAATTRIDHRRIDEGELFADFIRDVTGEPLTSEQEAAFARVLEGLRQAEREVLA